MSRIYMAGAGGMLGEAFYRVFDDKNVVRYTDKDVNASWLNYLDFRDAEAYRRDIINFRPDYLFHLGAHTDLEYCEREVDDAYATNTLPVEAAVHVANELKIPLLYISTAGIFDGRQETYDDWDQPNPLGHYARSKYLGERFVAENCRQHLVCRAGWMMGGGPGKDKKFINKLMKQIQEGSDCLYVVDDKLGTPTYTLDFARNVEFLLASRFWGIYNMICSGVTGRLEVANFLIDELSLQGKVTVQPVTSEYFSAEYFAARPASERLIPKKLQLRGLYIMRDWQVCLREYLNEYYK